ncbi:MAG: GtrA family protein [Sedimentisphaeraceae bacterium JB056]
MNQVIRFVFVTGFSFVTSIALMFILCEVFDIDKQISYAITLTILLITNFILCKKIVYRSDKSNHLFLLFCFIISSIVFRFTEFCMFTLFNYLGLWYILSVIISQSITFIIKFFWYGFLFKPKQN